MLHTVRSMLADNDFVHVFSFDFSKAFDTVRHVSLTSKLAQLALPDNIYNWVVDFLENHAHCTRYAGLVSAIAVIKASVIQGSAIRPAAYAVTGADLRRNLNHRNRIFVNDTYLVVPRIEKGTCQSEIEHLQAWEADNNLKLKRGKTKEIVFSAKRKVALPPPWPDTERVSSLRVLGVILNDKLTAADHVTALLSSGSSMLYAMRVLRSHGTVTTSLQQSSRGVYRNTTPATLAPKIQPAGQCGKVNR